MKSVLIRSLTLAVLASSISAFGAAPSQEDPSKEKETKMACPPADAGSPQMADQHSKREKREQKKMKKDHDRKQQEQEYSLLGIYG